ncbi:MULTISPECIES: hypothetical protein [unclassified Pasteurella]|uniref:hypothetical protein n=1 Tax=unclassified Pasteurella TaxID=2621516 RepID=UPI00107369D4|nr:hypothetical protein [Pasteurella sp. 19428wF3_WM03]TFU52508.1 hypothetical protein E4T92_03195 [Pasteurella sp. WM03]
MYYIYETDFRLDKLFSGMANISVVNTKLGLLSLEDILENRNIKQYIDRPKDILISNEILNEENFNSFDLFIVENSKDYYLTIKKNDCCFVTISNFDLIHLEEYLRGCYE